MCPINNKQRSDNIHKSSKIGRKDKRTITLVECQNLKNRTLISKSKHINKFAAKLCKCRIQLKDILSFLGFDCRDASIIILYLVVKNHFSKNQMNRIILSCNICCQNIKKSACFKWTYGLSSDDYRVALLLKLI